MWALFETTWTLCALNSAHLSKDIPKFQPIILFHTEDLSVWDAISQDVGLKNRKMEYHMLQISDRELQLNPGGIKINILTGVGWQD